MFTEQQIKTVHSKVKTGADFPAYIQEIKQLGLSKYEFWVADGRVSYHGNNNHQINSGAKYDAQPIAVAASPLALKHNIKVHQQGQTDFLTFCRQAAEAGVEKWVIDTRAMTCTYYDIGGIAMVIEPIPQAGY